MQCVFYISSTSQVTLTPFQELSSHMWLVAAVLDSAAGELGLVQCPRVLPCSQMCGSHPWAVKERQKMRSREFSLVAECWSHAGSF